MESQNQQGCKRSSRSSSLTITPAPPSPQNHVPHPDSSGRLSEVVTPAPPTAAPSSPPWPATLSPVPQGAAPAHPCAERICSLNQLPPTQPLGAPHPMSKEVTQTLSQILELRGQVLTHSCPHMNCAGRTHSWALLLPVPALFDCYFQGWVCNFFDSISEFRIFSVLIFDSDMMQLGPVAVVTCIPRKNNISPDWEPQWC